MITNVRATQKNPVALERDSLRYGIQIRALGRQTIARFSTRTKSGWCGDIFRHYLCASCCNQQIVVAYTLSCITVSGGSVTVNGRAFLVASRKSSAFAVRPACL